MGIELLKWKDQLCGLAFSGEKNVCRPSFGPHFTVFHVYHQITNAARLNKLTKFIDWPTSIIKYLLNALLLLLAVSYCNWIAFCLPLRKLALVIRAISFEHHAMTRNITNPIDLVIESGLFPLLPMVRALFRVLFYFLYTLAWSMILGPFSLSVMS